MDCFGDYDTIKVVEDRVIGTTPIEVELRDFNEFLEDTRMSVLKTSGREYTRKNSHTYSTMNLLIGEC